MGDNVAIRVLGPASITSEGTTTPLRGRIADLAALLTAAGPAGLTSEALAEELWLGEPPSSWSASLRNHIARLRRLLGPALVSSPGRYRLDAETCDVDGWRFRQLAGDGAHADALDLWSGDPFPGLDDLALVRSEAESLHILHADVLIRWADSEVATRPSDVAARLNAARERHPYNERLVCLIAAAHHQLGDTAIALDTLSDFCSQLAEDLGLQPGSAVRELESALLQGDEGAAIVGASPKPTDARSVPRVARFLDQLVSAGDFVGRDAELSELRAAIEEVAAGGGPAFFLVHGEAGIGKTRLMAEVAAATAPDVTTLYGACDPTASVPFAPFAEALKAVTSGRPRPWSGRLHDESDLTAMYHAVVDSLLELAETGPVVLILDDLHWIEPATAGLLRHCVRAVSGRRIALIGTSRTEELSIRPVAAELTQSLTQIGGRTLAITGLDHDAGQKLVESLVAAADHQIHERLVRMAGGHPLVLRQLAAGVIADGEAFTDEMVRFEHDALVEAALRGRVEPLDPTCIEVLEAAAVLGRCDPVTIHSAGSFPSLDAVVQHLERAIQAGVLHRRLDDRGVDFTHALFRQLIYDDLPPGRRAELHLATAGVLASQARAVPTDVAYHRLAAHPHGPLDRAVIAAVDAGRWLHQELAFADAVRLFDTALTLDPDLESLDDSDRVSTLAAHARATAMAGDRVRSLALFRSTFDLAEQEGDVDTMAALAVEYDHYGRITTDVGERLDLLDRVRAAVPPTEALCVTVDAEYVNEAMTAGRVTIDGLPEIQALARQTLDRAAHVPSAYGPAALAFTSATRGSATAEQRLALLEGALESIHEHGPDWVEPSTRAGRNLELVLLGRFADARHENDRYHALGERTGSPRHQWWARCRDVAFLQMQRRWQEALSLAAESFQLAEQGGVYDARATLEAQIGVEFVIEKHDMSSLVDMFDAHATTSPALPAWRMAEGISLAHAGRTERAKEILDSFAAAHDSYVTNAHTLSGHCLAARLAHELEDSEHVNVLWDLLAPDRGHYATIGAVIAVVGPVDTYLAELAVLRGDDEEAALLTATASDLEAKARAELAD